MRSEYHTLEIPQGEKFKVSVKHFTFLDVDAQNFPDSVVGVTLFLAHGIGLHKELYEPFLDELAELQMKEAQSLRFVVTEAWLIDCPNHGNSAILNEEKLVGNSKPVTTMNFVEAFLSLIDSGLVADVESKFLAFVGHSAGTTTAVNTVKETTRRKGPVRFSSLILLECPLLATPKESGEEKIEKWTQASPMVVKLLRNREDRWPSKSTAFDALRRTMPYNKWDVRALKLYVEHGLRPLPSLFYPNLKEGFTLKCHKLHEAESFTEIDYALAMIQALPTICELIPVHLVFAERSFLRPGDDEIELLAANKSDKYVCNKFRSVVTVPRAGHLIAQDAPRATAKCVLDALNKPNSARSVIHKL